MIDFSKSLNFPILFFLNFLFWVLGGALLAGLGKIIFKLKYLKMDKEVGDGPVLWGWPVHFFFGLIVFIVIFQILNQLRIPFGIIVSISFLMMTALTFREFKSSMRLFPFGQFFLFVFLFHWFSIQNLLNWGNNLDYSIGSSPHLSFGTIESGRYANIGHYIRTSGTIPVLGQNYLQSIISAVNPFGNTLFNLYTLLSVSQAVLALLIFDIARTFFFLGRMASLLCTFFMFYGSWAFFERHVFIIDSGSPLFFTGYVDTIFSIGSFMVFHIFYLRYSDWQRKAAIASLFIFSWCIFAPQNIFAVSLLITIETIVGFLTTRKLNSFIRIPSGVFVSLLLGSLCGGMFSPKILRTTTDIPGLIEAGGNTKPKIRLGIDFLKFYAEDIGFNFYHQSYNWQHILDYQGEVLNHPIINLIKVLSTIVIAILFFILYNKNLKFRINNATTSVQKHHFINKHFQSTAIWFMILSSLFVFFVSFGDNKWAVNRFLLPAIIISIFYVFYFGEKIFKLEAGKKKFRKVVLIILLINSFLPTIRSAIERGKIYLDGSAYQKIKQMNSIDGYIGKNH